jgi:hypothetical protein
MEEILPVYGGGCDYTPCYYGCGFPCLVLPLVSYASASLGMSSSVYG